MRLSQVHMLFIWILPIIFLELNFIILVCLYPSLLTKQGVRLVFSFPLHPETDKKILCIETFQ